MSVSILESWRLLETCLSIGFSLRLPIGFGAIRVQEEKQSKFGGKINLT